MSDSIDLDIFIGKVKEKMAELGINQAALAKQSAITPSAISQIFRKERAPSTGVVVKLANSLGVSVDYILGRTDSVAVEDLLQHDNVKSVIVDFLSLSGSDRQRIRDMIALLKISQRPPNEN